MDKFSLDFPRYLSAPQWPMGFRTCAEDFRVDENLGFEPSGEGEHLLLRIQKTDENTRWVALQLANHYGVSEQAVGYCGMKDRRAVTTQWFSVHLPGQQETSPIDSPGIEVLETCRHQKKLKPGMHAANRFKIVLRGQIEMASELEQRLETIKLQGVPNYFGEQRFGRGGNNLVEVQKIVGMERPRFKGKRGGLYLSAARAWIFNQVLASHVATNSWGACADGPLWGRGRAKIEPQQADLEAEILKPWSSWCDVLEHSGLRQERRNLVLIPQDFNWQLNESALTLSFVLAPGAYATAVLREVAVLVNAQQESPQVSTFLHVV